MAFPFHDSPTYPTIKSMEQWEKVKSSKVEMLIHLLQHHLSNDEHQAVDWTEVDGAKVPMWRNHDGNPMDLDIRQFDTDLMSKGKRKILVYMEFPMMAPLLQSVWDILYDCTVTLTGPFAGLEAAWH